MERVLSVEVGHLDGSRLRWALDALALSLLPPYIAGVASLIQQRMAIDRQRTSARIFLIGGTLFLISGPVQLIIAKTSLSTGWLNFALGAGWLILGLVQNAKARSARRDFEAEHGEGAGRQ